ncbi:hypothetical protein MSP8887_03667 [Marinomonas spartinae]|uniref:Transcriptional regulator SutA RNAP-binding domain-containing protein n=1 Tax=Marinomonas spartinae TaxID=1792290 RepID=A0A1A8TP38_9GAMM|nr:hypothetical protein [Marinomonas spartinae]MBJ7554593.1 hypothetical protein [Marinomonas spartinae]SBS35946.1 hypothetical protein MSP8886_03525 [Marinomonas spartinae]SBS39128.1 hypothetical protein MSP8887_03667 [Marinomonas spartinae]
MATKKKQPAASETSESIEKQMQEFLARGGQINKIDSGVSGQSQLTGPRHISLGNSKAKSQ